ncbi:MAG: hypothetical protein E7045_10110 [Lentisphaerae bacterium]|nr:hypothetical protein [Lentisphaerota bacterium]
MDLTYDRSMVPEIVFDERPDFVRLYYKAWELAAEHIKTIPGLPVERHMDEGASDEKIWIWDTCFMVHFCKYAPDFFPGIQSLDNFYFTMYDGKKCSCKIHHADNPPLFAWIEYEYYRFTGDKSRIHRNLVDRQYLQKHYDFLENTCRIGLCPEYSSSAVLWQKMDNGYFWSGCPSGMDNTPRGVDRYSFFWVDAISQMALSALYIARLAQEIGREDISDEYMTKYREKCQLINDLYFDETDGSYYDIAVATKHHIKVLTPASFWPLMAEAAPEERAARQIKTLLDPMKLGGKVALPSVSRDDPAFCSDGRYWKGAVWLPTSYMVTKALEKYGRFDLAADVAYSTVNHMAKTFDNFFPQTIWECYSPDRYAPATNRSPQRTCRPDFCGWSALGPISMLIENIMGFHRADAVAKRLDFHCRRSDFRYGIKRLSFGDVTCDIIVDKGTLCCKSNTPFTLCVDGIEHSITAGDNKIKLY